MNCDIDDRNCMLCVRFGQKVPFESATEVIGVGNGPNAAVSAARLGLSSALAAEIGDDENGRECLLKYKKDNVSTEFIGIHKGMRTNYHYVLQYEAERTILIKHENYERKLPNFDEPPQWFYLTSLPDGSLDYQLAVTKYSREKGIKLAFQPGTFQIRIGAEKLKDIYRNSEIFFCNKEEAQQILRVDERDIKKLLGGIGSLGPKIVVITDGRNGAYIMDETGTWQLPIYPDPAPPVNRTGAGDATASTTVAYIIKGLPPAEALLRGLVNSASVVQHVGAQAGLLSGSELESWYAKRPADFTPKKI